MKFWATICWLRNVSSLTKMTEASEVPLSMLIVSLPMPGQDRAHRLGQDDAAQGEHRAPCRARPPRRLVAVHRAMMPPRMISAENAASFRANPTTAVVNGPS